ncbi:Hypothetical predicted protein [Lecanosticta acicola]|uniref:Uncharacterized protein n=1 Tax=Lecanosticta acicola TaxID=111012 RepID=A0AAI8YRG6_9PEZI|nr:Hypothetical predicted protein [Lecanosticta acicola]
MDGIDLLKANFPEYFTDYKKPPKYKIAELPGDRGIANDALIESGDAVQCDQEYLNGVLDLAESLQCRILLWVFDTEDDDDYIEHLRMVNGEFKLVLGELKRLRAIPQLFPDSKTYASFFKQANKKMHRVEYLMQWKLKDDASISAKQKEKESEPVSAAGPTNPDTEANQAPWAKYCCAHDPQTFPTPSKASSYVPDMELQAMQFIPRAGFEIAEHWRRDTEKAARDIMAVSKDPSRLQKMIPHSHHMNEPNPVLGSEGKRATVTWPVRNAQTEGQGTEDAIALQGQFMAEMDEPDGIRMSGPFALLRGLFVAEDDTEPDSKFERVFGQ